MVKSSRILRARPALFVLALCVLAAPAISRAQTLASHVPADALIYLEWRGADDLGPGYDGSHLKAIVDKSQLSQLIHEAFPGWLSRISDQYPQAGQVISMVNAVGSMVNAVGAPLWAHPTAFYAGPLDMTNPQKPVPHFAILCDAGTDATTMTNTATNLAQQLGGDSPVQVTVQNFNNLVVIATYPFAQTPDKALADDADYKSAMAQCSAEHVAALYMDMQKLVKQIDDVVTAANDQQATMYWPRVREALGIDSIHRVAATDGFDGRDWVSNLYVEAPAPHTGLVSLIDAQPIGDETFKKIPATATMAGAGHFDFGKLFDVIHSGIGKIQPDASHDVDRYLAQANDTLGFDIQHDFLEAMGDEWSFYIDPNSNGQGTLGVAVMNKLRDADKFASSSAKLQTLANAGAKAALDMSGIPMLTIDLREQVIDGLHVNFAAFPLLTPAWAVKDGMMYAGLFPQIVVTAASGNSDGKSILDSDSFKDLRKRLGGPEKITGFTFIDVPKLAPLGYQNVLMLSRLFLGAGDMFGLKSPAMVVPTLAQIMPELEATGGITWNDDAGFHAKSISAFPGDELFVGDSGGASTLIQLISTFGTAAAQHNGGF